MRGRQTQAHEGSVRGGELERARDFPDDTTRASLRPAPTRTAACASGCSQPTSRFETKRRKVDLDRSAGGSLEARSELGAGRANRWRGGEGRGAGGLGLEGTRWARRPARGGGGAGGGGEARAPRATTSLAWDARPKEFGGFRVCLSFGSRRGVVCEAERPLVESSREESARGGGERHREGGFRPPMSPVGGAAGRGGLGAAGAASPAAMSQADDLRSKGNELLRNGRLAEAIALYSASVGVRPTPLALSNRAQARLCLCEWREAASDATKALTLDASHVKSWMRRATAREAQGEWAEAAQDWEEAMRLEPDNGAATEGRDRAYRRAVGLERDAGRGLWKRDADKEEAHEERAAEERVRIKVVAAAAEKRVRSTVAGGAVGTGAVETKEGSERAQDSGAQKAPTDGDTLGSKPEKRAPQTVTKAAAADGSTQHPAEKAASSISVAAPGPNAPSASATARSVSGTEAGAVQECPASPCDRESPGNDGAAAESHEATSTRGAEAETLAAAEMPSSRAVLVEASASAQILGAPTSALAEAPDALLEPLEARDEIALGSFDALETPAQEPRKLAEPVVSMPPSSETSVQTQSSGSPVSGTTSAPPFPAASTPAIPTPASASSSASRLPPPPATLPSTAVDFERAWRTASSSPAKQASLLLAMGPKACARLASSCLDADVISGIALALLGPASGAAPLHAAARLAELAVAPGAGLAAATLSNAQRQSIERAFRELDDSRERIKVSTKARAAQDRARQAWTQLGLFRE